MAPMLTGGKLTGRAMTQPAGPALSSDVVHRSYAQDLWAIRGLRDTLRDALGVSC